MSGNVAKFVASAAQVGSAPDTQRVDIAVHMAVRNLDELKQLVKSVSTPGSASYGRYLTGAAMKERFAPDAADVEAVRTLLTNAGMANVRVGPAGAYVAATATVAQLRTTFGVTQNLYRLGSVSLRANKEAPVIPANLVGKVLFVEGLDDTDSLRQPFHHSAVEGDLVAPRRSSAAASTVTPPPVASYDPSPYCDKYAGDLTATLSTAPVPYAQRLPWLNCGYTPQQIQAAYGMNQVKQDGTGVTVAIVDAYASPTLTADANHYATRHGLPALTAANFTLDIPNNIYNVNPGETCGPYGWWTEESLDMAAVHGSAPGANIVYIGARDCATSLTIALEDAIYNQKADIITNSYGFNGEGVDPATIALQDSDFMIAAGYGITVLFSSGDDGDLSQVNGISSGAYEATSPYVTGVGGTSLGLMKADGTKVEFGWGTYRDFLANAQVNSSTSITTSGLDTATNFGYTYDAFVFYSGSGGGISLVEPQPDYQAGIVPTALATDVNDASTYQVVLPQPQRVSPDVAMDADPYTGYLFGESYTIAGNGYSDTGCIKTSSTTEYCEIPEGGTSLASPLMAGVIARVDQARGTKGSPFVGFANPWLYGMKVGATLQSAGINDVTPPTQPYAVLRGYVTNSQEVRLVTINSVPFLIDTAPYSIFVCQSAICEGTDDVFNYVTTGYDDVTGLGVPYLPSLVTQ